MAVMSKFKMYQMVRIKGMPKGDINEFAKIRGVHGDGTYWIANLNSPFSGTISAVVTAEEIESLA